MVARRRLPGASRSELGGVVSVARRIGRAGAVALVAGTFGGAAMIAAEAVAAKTRRYAKPDMRLAMRTSIGDPAAPALRLVLLGDSSALGVGVERVADTVGGHLAELLAGGPATGGRRIELSSVAVAGSRGADLATQVARALLGPRPEVAVILVGTNDAMGLRRPAEAAAYLGGAVRRLRDAGVAVGGGRAGAGGGGGRPPPRCAGGGGGGGAGPPAGGPGGGGGRGVMGVN